ncbi:hypothetical protein [Maritimibacter sp. HL-12]|jgi:hypothetical protein|nr:hypothetical protein [Maritimibacter sp. HL-12]SMH51686.1 hypothetical protein SAMN05661107_2521 [Maritimibacter sp. HL-12]
MQTVFDSLTQRPMLTLGLGGFLGGFVLFYIVIRRARKRRIIQAGKHQG